VRVFENSDFGPKRPLLFGILASKLNLNLILESKTAIATGNSHNALLLSYEGQHFI
jgi:hypothetical protein